MANKSQSENLQSILVALQQAGQAGLSVDEFKSQVFKETNLSKTDIKKLLEILRSKGLVHEKIGKIDIRFTLISAQQ
jgi:hypothetical protein